MSLSPGSVCRVKWIDVYKALLIILMVVGHSGTPIVAYIYMFHMPAFFMVSGYLFNDQNDTFHFLKKKTISLLLPYIICNTIFISIYTIMNALGLYNTLQNAPYIAFDARLKSLLLDSSTPDLGGATWFILVLFEVEVLYFFLNKLLHNVSWLKQLMIIALYILGLYYAEHSIFLDYNFDLTLIALFYFYLGSCVKQRDILPLLDKDRSVIVFCLLSFLFFGSFYYNNSTPMNWPTRVFGNAFMQNWSILSSQYLLYLLAKYISDSSPSRYLVYLGRNTYATVAWHFVIFRLINGLFVTLNILPSDAWKSLVPYHIISNNGGWIIISFVTILSCSALSWVASKTAISDYIVNARIMRA